MSITFYSEASRTDLVQFLGAEYAGDTGIPVHLFSVVNATFDTYNGTYGVTDNAGGTLFLEEEHRFKSYGYSDPRGLIRTLNRCNAGIRC